MAWVNSGQGIKPGTVFGFPWGRMRWWGNWWEPRKAPPRPSPRKALFGDEEGRRSWVPGVSDDVQGALIRLMSQGLQHTTACRRAMSATATAVVTWRGSCDVRKLRGLNGRLGTRPGNRFAKVSPYPWLKRPRSNPEKPTRELFRASGPTLLVWGPGAGAEAAGRLWSGQNRSGVASLPQFAAKLLWRKLL